MKPLYSYALVVREKICNEPDASLNGTRYRRWSGGCRPGCTDEAEPGDFDCCKRLCDGFDWCTHLTWFDDNECRLYDYCTSLEEGVVRHRETLRHRVMATYRKETRARSSKAEAVEICHLEGADLVSISSAMENDLVANLSGSHGSYIGLNLKEDGAHRAWAWADGSPLSFEGWAPDQPDNDGYRGTGTGSEDAVYMNSEGHWHDVRAAIPLSESVVCERSARLGAGALYIADNQNHAVRNIDLETGLLVTSAGVLGFYGHAGDRGRATRGHLYSPTGVATDVVGRRVFVADSSNHAARVVAVTDDVRDAAL